MKRFFIESKFLVLKTEENEKLDILSYGLLLKKLLQKRFIFLR